jgi:transposase-like protein
MSIEMGSVTSRRLRVRRSIAEKRRIVERTFEPGMSVSRVARAESINAHQVFDWRRAYRRGELGGAAQQCGVLLPVLLAATERSNAEEAARSKSAESRDALAPTPTSSPSPSVVAPVSCAIHIELPGCAAIRVEHGTDAALLRAVLESLRR